ncbi:glycosyltransferase family 2 protein [Aquimarina aquimarini]|uniref:glycosyltransferase family 2 protein n=1 Tax=Aquimarina aquimarini TaxID=1191734 RepID=UPI000D5609C7|nr:glycosyltransferase family 2 protein [Aquimarina aquimarini]
MLLSFSIPNYNKGQELNEALESIFKLVENDLDNIEICISDNCSTDNSKEVLSYWNEKFPNFNTCFNQSNIGFQKNLINCLDMAKGQYVWIFGSDDTISEKYSFDFITSHLQSNNELYITNRELCDTEMNTYGVDNYFRTNFTKENTWNWSDKEDFISYLDDVKSVNALGCFISSLIVKKDTIDEIIRLSKIDDFYLSNIFPHVYIFLKIKNNSTQFNVTYLPFPIVKWRADNSSFADNNFDKYIDLLDLANSTHSRELIDAKIKLSNLIYSFYKKRLRYRSIIAYLVRNKFKLSKSVSFAVGLDFNSNIKHLLFGKK